MTSLPLSAAAPFGLPVPVPLDRLAELFDRLDGEEALRRQFLDDPAAVLAEEIGLNWASQHRSADNQLLVELLDRPDLGAVLHLVTAPAGSPDIGISISHASASTSTTFSSSSSTSVSASVSTSSTFTTGGASTAGAEAVDAARVRLRIRSIAAAVADRAAR